MLSLKFVEYSETSFRPTSRVSRDKRSEILQLPGRLLCRILTFSLPRFMFDVQMLADFRPIHCSKFWRATYIVCMLLVFSYILFDVLDLDGSDFPRPRAPVERNVVVAEVPKEIKQAYLPDRTELWVDHSVLVPAMSGESVHVRLTRALTFSPLDSARTRGYRIALPRSSPSDPFQSL